MQTRYDGVSLQNAVVAMLVKCALNFVYIYILFTKVVHWAFNIPLLADILSTPHSSPPNYASIDSLFIWVIAISSMQKSIRYDVALW